MIYGIHSCIFAVYKFNGVLVMSEVLQCGMVHLRRGKLVRRTNLYYKVSANLVASSKTFKTNDGIQMSTN